MPLLPEAKYKARAIEWSQVTENENSHNEEIRVLFEITDGDFKGTQRTWRGYFSEKTAERTLESLRYMGWTGDDITDVQGLDANEVQIVIGHEMYEDKLQEKIQWVNRLAGVFVGTPMNDARKMAFKERMKGLVMASKQPAARSPQQQQRAAASGGGAGAAGGDESFPFGANANGGNPPQERVKL